MNGTIGEIRGFGGNFAPRAWAFCNGQLLSINQNQALFSILGTTYGGDGRTSFALPDLRGRVPISAGTGPGLSTHKLGQRSGQEIHTITSLEMPNHFHTANTAKVGTVTSLARDVDAEESGAEETVAGNTQTSNYAEITSTDLVPHGIINDSTNLVVQVAPTGASQWHNNLAPYLTINWVICMFGIFPSRS